MQNDLLVADTKRTLPIFSGKESIPYLGLSIKFIHAWTSHRPTLRYVGTYQSGAESLPEV